MLNFLKKILIGFSVVISIAGAVLYVKSASGEELFGAYRFNPFTKKLDYYTPTSTVVNGTGVINEIAYFINTTTIDSDANLTYDPLSDKLNLDGTLTSSTLDQYLVDYDAILAPSATSTGTGGALSISVSNQSQTFRHANIRGLDSTVTNGKAGMTEVNGLRSVLNNLGSGTNIWNGYFNTVLSSVGTNAGGIYSQVQTNSGSYDSVSGLYIPAFLGTANPAVTYGLRVDAPGNGIIEWTAAFGTGNSYFAGSLNVGSAASSSYALNVVGNINASDAYKYNNVNAILASTTNFNWFLGGSGNTTATGTNNISLGSGALAVLGGGSNNIALGSSALEDNTIGSGNAALGVLSLASNTTGDNNFGLGYLSMFSNTAGSNNVGVGDQTLTNNTTGNGNVSVGSGALTNVTSSNNNVAVGLNAGYSLTGTGNTALGYSAGENYNGSLSVIIGNEACKNVSGSGLLCIANNTETSPLIYGSFTDGWVNINKSLGLGRIGNDYLTPPTTTLFLQGSFSTDYTDVTTNYTLDDLDNTLFVTSTTDIVITMLDPNAYDGMEVKIFQQSATSSADIICATGCLINNTVTSTLSGEGNMVSLKAMHGNWYVGN